PEFSSVVALFLELDKSITTFTKGTVPSTPSISLRPPPPEPHIHCFYTAVSWLYVRVVEAGQLHFPFLAERAAALRTDTSGALPKFREDINTFRTLLQHNLNLDDPSDAAKLSRCETWMATALGRQLTAGKGFWPEDADWVALAHNLRRQAKEFAEIANATVAAMSKDPFADDAIAQWALRSSRSLSPHKFDRIAEEAATELGLPHLDVVKLRKVNLDKWNQRLRLLNEGADFPAEARRAVEASLLDEADNYLPLGGADVIRDLGVKPGPDVRRALQKARALYRQAPRSKEDLLSALKELQTAGTL
ncbi:MAG: hypothetical protein WCL11_24660, partial [Verrucomicrobiota bacterium]